MGGPEMESGGGALSLNRDLEEGVARHLAALG